MFLEHGLKNHFKKVIECAEVHDLSFSDRMNWCIRWVGGSMVFLGGFILVHNRRDLELRRRQQLQEPKRKDGVGRAGTNHKE